MLAGLSCFSVGRNQPAFLDIRRHASLALITFAWCAIEVEFIFKAWVQREGCPMHGRRKISEAWNE